MFALFTAGHASLPDQRLSALFCSTSNPGEFAVPHQHAEIYLRNNSSWRGQRRLSCRVHARSFINSPDEVVAEALEGLVACTPHLQRLGESPGVSHHCFECLDTACCRLLNHWPAVPCRRITESLLRAQVKVVLDSTHNNSKVAIISGKLSCTFLRA